MAFIADMDSATPGSGDPVSQGDDQLRGIKLDVQSSFPNVDGAVVADAADLTAATEPETALETANGVTPTLTGHQTGYAPRYGIIEGSVGDQTAELQLAINSGYATELPPGTISFSGTLTLPDGADIYGAGAQTVLDYTGAGTAIESVDGAVRSYDHNLRDFVLQNSGTGLIGLALEGVSRAMVQSVFIDAFGTGLTIDATDAFCTYNRLINVTANQSTAVGFDVIGPTSNGNLFVGCRANAGAGIGLRITSGNQNLWTGGVLESIGGTGVHFAGGTFNTLNEVNTTRFESNTGNDIEVDADCTNIRLMDNYNYTTGNGTTIVNNSTSTLISGIYNDVSGVGNVNPSRSEGTYPAQHFQRNGNGVSGTGAGVLVEDTWTTSGEPITLASKSGRPAFGRALSVGTLTTESFGVRGDGRLYTNQKDSGNTGTFSAGINIYDPVTGAIVGRIPVQEAF
jgi:hypothetical protein